MRIDRYAMLGALGLLLAASPLSAILAADNQSDSPYRLKLEKADQHTAANDAYLLDHRYRPPQPATAQTTPISPVSASTSPPSPPPPLPENLDEQPFSKEIAKAANTARLDPVLVHAVIYVESRYQHRAVSLKGAYGLMQVLPETAARYGISDPASSPRANLKAGTLYLSDLIHMFNNRLDLALAAYNAGEGTVQHYKNKVPPYPETQQYVRDVLAKYNEWHNAVAARNHYYLTLNNGSAPPPTPAPAHEKPPFVQYLSGTRLVQSDTPTRD